MYNFFLMKLFSIALASSKTHFDIVTSKIGANSIVNNVVIYGDILVNFLRIVNTKSTISHKIKIAKLWKLVLHPLQFWIRSFDIFHNFLRIWSDHIAKTKFAKIRKLFSHSFQHIAHLLILYNADYVCMHGHRENAIITH